MSLDNGSYEAATLILAGLTETEAAERLAVSQPTVSRRVTRACRAVPGLDACIALAKVLHHRHRRSHGRRCPLAGEEAVS